MQHGSRKELKQQLLTAIKADEGLIRCGCSPNWPKKLGVMTTAVVETPCPEHLVLPVPLGPTRSQPLQGPSGCTRSDRLQVSSHRRTNCGACGLRRTGRLTPEVREAVEAMEAAAEAEPLRLGPGAVDGQFELLLNTTNYLDDDACTTLGTLTFQQFGPSDLRVRSRPPSSN